MNIAKLIADACKHFNRCAGDEVVRFRHSYSGRGMFGKTCVGITSNNQSDCNKVIAMVINDAYDASGDADSDDEEFDFRSMVEILLDYSRDSMGTGYILYWDNIQAILPE